MIVRIYDNPSKTTTREVTGGFSRVPGGIVLSQDGVDTFIPDHRIYDIYQYRTDVRAGDRSLYDRLRG